MTGSGLGKVPNYSPFVPHRTPHFRFSCSVLWPEISRQIIIFSEVISRAVSAQRSRKTRGPAPPYSTHARPHTYQYVFAPRPLYLCLISPRRNLLAGARRPFAAVDFREQERLSFPTPLSRLTFALPLRPATVLKDLVVTQFGLDKWALIGKELNLTDGDAVILELKQYPDVLTVTSIVATAEVLGVAVDELLRVFGAHFVEYMLQAGHLKMLRSMGDSLETFLSNINHLVRAFV